MTTRRWRRRRVPSRRVRSREVPSYLRLGLPAAGLVCLIRWMGLLWGWGWLVLALGVYFVTGYVAADLRAIRTFGHRRVRSAYVSDALLTALVAWGVGWGMFEVTLMVWLLFQDVFGKISGLIAAIPWTLPLAFIGGVAAGQWRQAS